MGQGQPCKDCARMQTAWEHILCEFWVHPNVPSLSLSLDVCGFRCSQRCGSRQARTDLERSFPQGRCRQLNPTANSPFVRRHRTQFKHVSLEIGRQRFKSRWKMCFGCKNGIWVHRASNTIRARATFCRITCETRLSSGGKGGSGCGTDVCCM